MPELSLLSQISLYVLLVLIGCRNELLLVKQQLWQNLPAAPVQNSPPNNTLP